MIMKKFIPKYLIRSGVIVLLAAVTGLTCTNKNTDDLTKDAMQINVIRNILAGIHYTDVEINDAFSKKIFDTYLEQSDYNKRLFTKKDVDKLKAYEDKIDDDLLNNRYRIFDLVYNILEARINETEKYYKEILSEPFDYTVDEEIELDHDKLEYAANSAELKERWRKSLKYQVLTKIHNKLNAQELALEKSDTVTVKSVAELEKDARSKILKDHEQWYERLKKLKREDRFADYLNAVTSSYDPHTNFFPPKDKENFDISISGRLEGIGATLQETDGYIKVTRIVPGSASYRQGELETGDLILKVGQGEDDAIDIVDMRLDEAVQLIRGPKGTEVRLTVRKIDGSEQVIPIIRDIVILDETYAKSAIVKDSLSGKSFGYIKLPKFYADFTNTGGRNSSSDVAKEIKKLKKEGVDGIIFDVRDNGGGSLQDVITMSGLFIEKGPIVQTKARVGGARVYPDNDPRIQFNGPLVVMINSLSASASEIFAAAIQDYNRGIIVGSKSSYGKGTVQRFENMDNYVNSGYDNIKPLGSMKMTTSKFYRINGGATQLKGVESDIIIPDNYMYIEIGEKELDNALEWDEIKPAEYKKWPEGIKNYDQIMSESKKRIANDSTFQLIEQNAKRFQELRDETKFSLNLEQYRTDRKEEKKEADKYVGLMKKNVPNLSVKTLSEDNKVIEMDSTKASSFEQLNKNLKRDKYLWEAIQIIEDME